MLLWTRGCKYLFQLALLSPLGIFPEAELLDHMVVLFLILWGSSTLFSIVAVDMQIFITCVHCLDLFNTSNIVNMILRSVSTLRFTRIFNLPLLLFPVLPQMNPVSLQVNHFCSKKSGRCWQVNILLIVCAMRK